MNISRREIRMAGLGVSGVGSKREETTIFLGERSRLPGFFAVLAVVDH